MDSESRDCGMLCNQSMLLKRYLQPSFRMQCVTDLGGAGGGGRGHRHGPLNRPVVRIRITGGPPLWRIVLTCDIRRHLGHLPGRVSAIEGVCRSVFGTVQHTVRHKRAESSFVKKLAINMASVHFAIDKIRIVLQAWALIIHILYVTLLMTSRAMGCGT